MSDADEHDEERVGWLRGLFRRSRPAALGLRRRILLIITLGSIVLSLFLAITTFSLTRSNLVHASDSPASADRRSGGLDVSCLRPLGASFNVEGHLLAFGQRAKAFTGDSGKMDKNVLATIGRRNETKTLGFVKPLDGSCCHDNYLVKPGHY